ncbi:MAG: HAD-IIB family hydrolase [Marinovum sp.]|nr:HAD-IIB family hydrolase [Marinovum sp.]
MQPIHKFPKDIAKNITCVFTDIDDTLTTEGSLPACAYNALEALTKAGIHVAPITGRPAGWCDMIARLWPVAGVVGENGAFYFSYDRHQKKMIRAYDTDELTRTSDRKRLDNIAERILTEVPGCAISVDQTFRDTDLAIDIAEDVPELDEPSVLRVKEIFEEEGAVAKVSSIHVNGWYGTYSKLTMSRRFAIERLGLDVDSRKENFVFCGDSPNDGSMFEFFPFACGVANVKQFEGKMPSYPAFVSEKKGGEGFVEIAEILLKARCVKVVV